MRGAVLSFAFVRHREVMHDFFPTLCFIEFLIDEQPSVFGPVD